jgi:hypothetical protein
VAEPKPESARKEVITMAKKQTSSDWKFADFKKLASVALKTDGLRILRNGDQNVIYLVFNNDNMITLRIAKDGSKIYGSTNMKMFQQEVGRPATEAVTV